MVRMSLPPQNGHGNNLVSFIIWIHLNVNMAKSTALVPHIRVSNVAHYLHLVSLIFFGSLHFYMRAVQVAAKPFFRSFDIQQMASITALRAPLKLSLRMVVGRGSHGNGRWAMMTKNMMASTANKIPAISSSIFIKSSALLAHSRWRFAHGTCNRMPIF